MSGPPNRHLKLVGEQLSERPADFTTVAPIDVALVGAVMVDAREWLEKNPERAMTVAANPDGGWLVTVTTPAGVVREDPHMSLDDAIFDAIHSAMEIGPRTLRGVSARARAPVHRGRIAPGDIVLDPFAGTGTTLEVAARLGRSAVGIELSPTYADLITKRLAGLQLPLSGVA